MERLFFALLHSALHGTPVPADAMPDAPDWRQIVVMADKQAMTPLIAEAIAQLPPAQQPPAQIMERLMVRSMQALTANTRLCRVLADTVAWYRSRGVETVLLKGQGVALNYPRPELRCCGDIDLYIGKRNYAEACRLAPEWQTAEPPEEENYKHFCLMREGIEIEMHRYAAVRFDYRYRSKFNNWLSSRLDPDTAPGLRHIEVNGTDVLVPPADVDAIYIFFHAWMHIIIGGIGLRQLCDWVMHLKAHKAEIDIAVLGRNLRRFGLLRQWQEFAWIAVHYLGMPEDEMPFYSPEVHKNARKIFDEIMIGGNFGTYSPGHSVKKRSTNYLVDRFYTLTHATGLYARTLKYSPLEVIGRITFRINEEVQAFTRHITGK